MTKFIRISGLKDVSSPGLDGHRYALSFEIGEERSGTFQPQGSQSVTITTSGTLQAVWGLTNSQVADASATAAATIITDVASRGGLGQLEPIQLNTYTASKQPPSVPRAIAGTLIPIPDRPKPIPKPERFSILSEDISELRDQINTLSNALIGGRLLELPQERAILDVYKSADTQEAFRHRVQSLAGICVAINKSALGSALGKQSTTEVGSIILLQEYVEKVAGNESAAKVCNVLKNVNELRKGYPAHGDNTDKFLHAHDFFGQTYPIQDYPTAWDAILGAYLRAMKVLLEVLASERNKNAKKTGI